MKKLLKLALMLVTLNSLIANAASAQNDYDNYVARFNEYISANKECYDRINSKDAGKTVAKEIIFFDMNASNKITLSIDANKLSDSQKEVLKEYLSDNQMCRSNTKDYIARLPSVFGNLISTYRQDMDNVYIKLLTSSITIGEANIKKAELVTKLNSDTSQANNDYIRALNDRNSSDVDRRQRAAAILIPYLQNNKPYQLPMPQVQQPVIRPSVNTNCTTYGNQTNCTSQ